MTSPSLFPLDTDAPTASVSDVEASEAQQLVGQNAVVASGLSEEDLEAQIKHAGNLLVRFVLEGKRSKAQRVLALIHRLRAKRSPEYRAEQLRRLAPTEEFQTFGDLAAADIAKGNLG